MTLPDEHAVPPKARLISGTALICLGIGITAAVGYDGAIRFSLDAAAFVAVMLGAMLSGLVSFRR